MISVEFEVDYYISDKHKVLCAQQINYLQKSGSVFRKIQQDRRFSRLGRVAWSICVGH